MAELGEQIKNLSQAQQLMLAQQMWDLEAESDGGEEDEDFKAGLVWRAQHAIENSQSGISWEQAKTKLLAKQREQNA